MLVSLGASPQFQTRHGETVTATALRYKRSECVDFLDRIGRYSSTSVKYPTLVGDEVG